MEQQHTFYDLMGADHSVFRVGTSLPSHPLQGAGCDQLAVCRANVDAVLRECRSQQHEPQRYLRVKSYMREHGRHADLRKKLHHLTSIRSNDSLNVLGVCVCVAATPTKELRQCATPYQNTVTVRILQEVLVAM